MSKHSEVLDLSLAPAAAELVCQEAVADLGWRVLESGPGILVVKEVSPKIVSFTWSAKIAVVVQGEGHRSAVELRGSITGMGPVQKGHLRGQVGALKNRISVIAQRTGSAPSDDVAELERLAALHGAGALTDEEFAMAKSRALGP